ncbi:PREDICTED: uncharacterized protein LOC109363564 [Lupinus angustifolius]|uniref:uncharacterized protein LOC109363564 n=1 Tax=Lupinus angustifolius TaxID=3871 RepID=UPI00092EFD2B|nr:PREDICTED: uncharacterized protein LOC109363564 [Lupinus angustifolius]
MPHSHYAPRQHASARADAPRQHQPARPDAPRQHTSARADAPRQHQPARPDAPRMSSTTSSIPFVSASMDLSQDPSSPYYVHPSDNPASALVSPVLNGENYNHWSIGMKRSLISKQKLALIDGSILMPPKTDPTYKAWERANNMVISWITRSVSPSIAQSIVWMDKTYEIWEELEERLSQGNLYRIAELHQCIFNFRQGELDISNYFTQLKILWDELDNFRPLPKCTCEAMPDTKKYFMEDRVIAFLRGLNDTYAGIRSQIMILEPLPSLRKVFSLVIQQERQTFGNETDMKVMAINGPWRGRGSSVNRGR